MLTPKKIRSESGNLSSGEMQNEICAENTKNKRCIEQYTKVDCERLKCDARLLGCKLKAEKKIDEAEKSQKGMLAAQIERK